MVNEESRNLNDMRRHSKLRLHRTSMMSSFTDLSTAKVDIMTDLNPVTSFSNLSKVESLYPRKHRLGFDVVQRLVLDSFTHFRGHDLSEIQLNNFVEEILQESFSLSPE